MVVVGPILCKGWLPLLNWYWRGQKWPTSSLSRKEPLTCPYCDNPGVGIPPNPVYSLSLLAPPSACCLKNLSIASRKLSDGQLLLGGLLRRLWLPYQQVSGVPVTETPCSAQLSNHVATDALERLSSCGGSNSHAWPWYSRAKLCVNRHGLVVVEPPLVG